MVSSGEVFFVFCLILYEIVDTEYSLDNYKSSKLSIGAIIKNPKTLKFVPNHLKAKKMCKHAVKKLLFVKKYVPQLLMKYSIQTLDFM